VIPEEGLSPYPSNEAPAVSRPAPLPTESAPRSLSERIWGFRWEDHLPLKLDDQGAVLEKSDYETVTGFARENLASIFELDTRPSPFLHGEGDAAAKERFLREVVDFFAVRVDGRLVGIHTANLADWSTYYLRHSSLLPEFEGRRFFHKYISFMLETLGQQRVARLQLETSPANLKILQLVTRYRFRVTGSQTSERWGNVLLLTRFLDPACERVFLNQYCFGNHPRASDSDV
jgi:hypothetical protein